MGYCSIGKKTCADGESLSDCLECYKRLRTSLENALQKARDTASEKGSKLKTATTDLTAMTEERDRLKAAIRQFGGTPEFGHGWNSCQICGGWREHKEDCVLYVAALKLQEVES